MRDLLQQRLEFILAFSLQPASANLISKTFPFPSRRFFYSLSTHVPGLTSTAHSITLPWYIAFLVKVCQLTKTVNADIWFSHQQERTVCLVVGDNLYLQSTVEHSMSMVKKRCLIIRQHWCNLIQVQHASFRPPPSLTRWPDDQLGQYPDESAGDIIPPLMFKDIEIVAVEIAVVSI